MKSIRTDPRNHAAEGDEPRCAPLCGASKAYGRFDKWWHHEPQCPIRIAALDQSTLNAEDMLQHGGCNSCAALDALEDLCELVPMLADQQAMPNDWYAERLQRAREALAAARGDIG